jgi:hypothetical protein
VSRGHDAEAAATAALDRPEQVRVGAGVGDPHGTVGGDDLGLEQARRGRPVSLREAAEAAALDQAGNAHGEASAALDIAARLGRDGIVDLPPDRSCLDRDRRVRLLPPGASRRDERVVQGDRVHPPGPDQQGIRRIGGALVAVAATLHDQSQPVLAGEVHGGDDILGRLGRHRVGPRSRRPRVDPAKGLGQPDLVAEKIGVLQVLDELRAGGARRHLRAGGERRPYLDEPPSDIAAEPVPARFGRPCRVARTDAGHGTGCRRGPCRGEQPGRWTWQERDRCGRCPQQTSSVHRLPPAKSSPVGWPGRRRLLPTLRARNDRPPGPGGSPCSKLVCWLHEDSTRRAEPEEAMLDLDPARQK